MRTLVLSIYASLIVRGFSLLVGATMMSHDAHADTFYVTKNGHNNHTCNDAKSRTKSKLTINAGLTCLTAGDTLSIGAGTYDENIDSNDSEIPSGTSWDNVITISAIPGESVILKPQRAYEVVSLAGAHICYVVFDGLVLDATNVSTDAFSMTNGTHHIRLQNSEIKNAPRQGILVTKGTGGTDHHIFRNLDIHDNGHDSFSHGMYISTSNNLIERNQVYRNSGYGIHIYDDVGDVNNNIVRFNITWGNSTTHCCSAGILVGSGKANIAYNNIVYSNAYGIIAGFSNAIDTKIYNNTVYSNIHYGIQNRSTSANAIIKNNIVYLNPHPIEDLGPNAALARNLTSDPMFVNAAALDFRLKPGSPAIDAGEILSEVTVDFRGVNRTNGNGPDIGAYEFGIDDAASLLMAPSELRVDPTEEDQKIQ